jgi:hypothetical protein
MSRLSGANRDKVTEVVAAVRNALSTSDGAILLDLLEKSTLLSVLPILSDDRALSARNAQALICSDLRRIMSDEHEQLLLAKGGASGPGQSRRGRG